MLAALAVLTKTKILKRPFRQKNEKVFFGIYNNYCAYKLLYDFRFTIIYNFNTFIFTF